MSSSNVENISPQTIRMVLKELAAIQASPPEGIKVIFNEHDITNIEALVEGPAGTPYAGGVFRVKLHLTGDFPRTPPRGYFITRLFHPNVASNGEICVNTLKKDWKPEMGIKHLLLTIKCLLIVPNPESALNEEAGKMLLEQYEQYCQRARMMTEIHAQSCRSGCSGATSSSSAPGPQAKKLAADSCSAPSSSSSSVAIDKKRAKDKTKRTLKRL